MLVSTQTKDLQTVFHVQLVDTTLSLLKLSAVYALLEPLIQTQVAVYFLTAISVMLESIVA